MFADLKLAGIDRRGDAVATRIDLHYRTGAENFTTTTNSEQIIRFMAMTPSEVPRGPASTPAR